MKPASAMTLSAAKAVRCCAGGTMTLSDSRTIEKIGMRNSPMPNASGASTSGEVVIAASG